MLQQDLPSDYCVATGESYSIRQLVDEAFSYADLDWREHVEFDPRYVRPAEVDHLEGDANKAGRVLGWKPRVDFHQLVRMMVDHDHELAKGERTLADHGHDQGLRGSAIR
jgi:GDPmannose 4,6-dehydratase